MGHYGNSGGVMKDFMKYLIKRLPLYLLVVVTGHFLLSIYGNETGFVLWVFIVVIMASIAGMLDNRL